jgi:glycosyltransferase involved in cell wall biosynthesis
VDKGQARACEIGEISGPALPERADAIRVLCVNDDVVQGIDRPTLAMFIGMHRAGVAVTVVCPPDHPHYPRLVAEQIPVVDIRFRRNFDRAAIAKVREELIRGAYDIVHTFNNKAISNVLLAARDLPVKIVAYRGIVGAVGFLDPMSWMRYLNPRIDRIVCVAEAIRQHFLSMRPKFLRMPPERPVTIHKGHKLEWYAEAPADLTTVGVPSEAFVVGCVANYRPRKGIEVLVDALDELPDDVHLLLIGRMDAKRLTRRIERSRAKARIHRTGFRQDAPSLSAACDVFCLPSTRREGLSRAIIEAMAYGVPPVVTDSGGSPELVVDGVSGLVVPANDSGAIARAIERLYRDDEFRARVGRAARNRIEFDFRNEDTVQKTIALYQSLL